MIVSQGLAPPMEDISLVVDEALGQPVQLQIYTVCVLKPLPTNQKSQMLMELTILLEP